MTDDTGDVGIAADVRAHGDVLYRERTGVVHASALGSRHQAGSMVRGGMNRTGDVKIFDSRVMRDGERSGKARLVDVDVQSMSVAVKGTAEYVIFAVVSGVRTVAEHRSHADIRGQPEILSGVLCAAAVDMRAQRVPVVGRLDKVRLFLGSLALKQAVIFLPLRVERQVA